nr:trypsin-like peptidase domain-containing protein [Streptomyces aurantiacus]
MPPGAASGLDAGRVAEVIVAGGTGTHRRGSGYLVAVGRVLTAAHVIRDAHSIQVRFDADQPTEQVHRAEVAWVDPRIDVAVLAVDGDQQHVAWTDFGRVPEHDAELRCSTMGFPAFKMRSSDDGTSFRDSCHVHGTCAVLSNRREGTLDFHVVSGPAATYSARSPWEGMSGAAVFSGESIIGIVGRHHLADGPDHLAVLRADRWHGQLTPDAARLLEDAIGVPLVPSRLTDAWHQAGGVKRTAAGPSLGRLVKSLAPEHALALEVHPAIQARGPDQKLDILPPYLQRPHVDDQLREAMVDAEDGSRLLMLVGGSSTGKTRAAWEAVRSWLSDGWRLWHPLTPDRPTAVLKALRSGRVAPRTVIWLNEAQLYLSPRPYGEQVSAALQELLAEEKIGPLLILGSLWPDYWKELTADPVPGDPTPFAAARALLGLATVIHVPDTFSEHDLRMHAQMLDTDPRLVQAGASVGGRLTQFLAGAPELIRRYRHAPVPARALLWAAMDARRLGHGPRLPRAFLEEAASGYLSDDEWDDLDDAWFNQALAYLSEPCRGARGPLTPIRPRPGSPEAGRMSYRLADYLEQHGNTERQLISPPAGFWDAAVHAATALDVRKLAESAHLRWRLRHAAHLYTYAADQQDETELQDAVRLPAHKGGAPGADYSLTDPSRDDAVTQTETETDELWAIRQEELHTLADAHQAAEKQHEEMELLPSWDRAESFESRTQREMAPLIQAAPDMVGVQALMAEAVQKGNNRLLLSLASIKELAGDPDSAETYLRQAAEAGYATAFSDLARLRELAGDYDTASTYVLAAAARGELRFLEVLVERREQYHLPAARLLAHRAADAGYAGILVRLAVRRTWAEGTDSEWVRLWRYGLTADGHISRPW